MRSTQSKGQLQGQVGAEPQPNLETKKYHNYSLAFYQKDADLN